MTLEDNKAIVLSWFDAFNDRNLGAADRIFAPEYTLHEPGLPPDFPKGPEGLKAFAGGLLRAFPDWHATVEDVMAEGDRVVLRFTEEGTHQGQLEHIPPSGKKVRIGGVSIFRMSGGKIAEEWEFADSLGLLQQIGAIPAGEEGEG
ncbi:MAG TPA: ester cyclase [Anaerolineales bacterium]